jgi:tRNA threonylcarbamoyladenosine biosynthesis protein TsaE
MNLVVREVAAMIALGGCMARACHGAMVIFLYGSLGAGKTTLVRGFMRGMGYAGAVKSPTYTLLEPYEANGRMLYHLDLYRVSDAAELDFLGLRELQDGHAVMLVEWPEYGQGFLPPADVVLTIEYSAEGRRVALEGLSGAGVQLVREIAAS